MWVSVAVAVAAEVVSDEEEEEKDDDAGAAEEEGSNDDDDDDDDDTATAGAFVPMAAILAAWLMRARTCETSTLGVVISR